jgi:hypothetical protein
VGGGNEEDLDFFVCSGPTIGFAYFSDLLVTRVITRPTYRSAEYKDTPRLAQFQIYAVSDLRCFRLTQFQTYTVSGLRSFRLTQFQTRNFF